MSQLIHYIFDHSAALDHEDFARIIVSDKSRYAVSEILTAVQFWWEERVDEHCDPMLDDVLRVLIDHFDFLPCEKEDYRNVIRFILAEEKETDVDTYVINGSVYVYMDLYWARERLCGPGRPERLYQKWLTDQDIRAAVEACRKVR